MESGRTHLLLRQVSVSAYFTVRRKTPSQSFPGGFALKKSMRPKVSQTARADIEAKLNDVKSAIKDKKVDRIKRLRKS